jgi:hypothetical protein
MLRNKKRRCGACRCLCRAPPFRRPAAADSAPRRPEGAVSFRLWAATSPKVVAVQFPREHAISTAVFFHFSVVGAKRGGGPAGRGACRSERAGWPARQAADLRPHRTSREPFPFTRSSTSAVPAPTAAVDDRRSSAMHLRVHGCLQRQWAKAGNLARNAVQSCLG